MRWRIYPADPKGDVVEVEADKVTEFRNGWIALVKERRTVACCSPNSTLLVVEDRLDLSAKRGRRD